MERQLTLLEVDRTSWQLDERTREVGRRGIAAAREALRRPPAEPAADAAAAATSRPAPRTAA